MIKRIKVERWVTSDGTEFDRRDKAERYETSCTIRSVLKGAIGDDMLGESDWQAAVAALLDSPYLTIIRRAKP